MEHRVELIIDPLRGEKVTVGLPLTLRRPVEETGRALGLPPTVDLTDPIVAKAVALAGAAADARPPIRFAVFGGTAFRLTCPSSNDPALGLRHDLHDLDLAILLKDAREVRRFLGDVANSAGAGLTFFETSGDRIYNSLSGGARLRWHMTVAQRGTAVTIGTLDLVADTFEFCHRIDIRADVEASAAHGWALAPAHLLLTKGQFIQRIPREESAPVADRVLEPLGKRGVVIGPEAKDVRDLVALIHDHPMGEAPDEISPALLRRELSADWGLWKTFGLNLEMVTRSPIVRGLPPDPRRKVEGRLGELRSLVAGLQPKRRFNFLGGPWWQEVDATPSVDLTVSTGGPSPG